MPRPPKYPVTIGPVKATPDQRRLLLEEAEERRLAIADIVREAVDARYGLQDGEQPVAAGA